MKEKNMRIKLIALLSLACLTLVIISILNKDCSSYSLPTDNIEISKLSEVYSNEEKSKYFVTHLKTESNEASQVLIMFDKEYRIDFDSFRVYEMITNSETNEVTEVEYNNAIFSYERKVNGVKVTIPSTKDYKIEFNAATVSGAANSNDPVSISACEYDGIQCQDTKTYTDNDHAIVEQYNIGLDSSTKITLMNKYDIGRKNKHYVQPELGQVSLYQIAEPYSWSYNPNIQNQEIFLLNYQEYKNNNYVTHYSNAEQEGVFKFNIIPPEGYTIDADEYVEESINYETLQPQYQSYQYYLSNGHESILDSVKQALQNNGVNVDIRNSQAYSNSTNYNYNVDNIYALTSNLYIQDISLETVTETGRVDYKIVVNPEKKDNYALPAYQFPEKNWLEIELRSSASDVSNTPWNILSGTVHVYTEQGNELNCKYNDTEVEDFHECAIMQNSPQSYNVYVPNDNNTYIINMTEGFDNNTPEFAEATVCITSNNSCVSEVTKHNYYVHKTRNYIIENQLHTEEINPEKDLDSLLIRTDSDAQFDIYIELFNQNGAMTQYTDNIKAIITEYTLPSDAIDNTNFQKTEREVILTANNENKYIVTLGYYGRVELCNIPSPMSIQITEVIEEHDFNSWYPEIKYANYQTIPEMANLYFQTDNDSREITSIADLEDDLFIVLHSGDGNVEELGSIIVTPKIINYQQERDSNKDFPITLYLEECIDDENAIVTIKENDFPLSDFRVAENTYSIYAELKDSEEISLSGIPTGIPYQILYEDTTDDDYELIEKDETNGYIQEYAYITLTYRKVKFDLSLELRGNAANIEDEFNIKMCVIPNSDNLSPSFISNFTKEEENEQYCYESSLKHNDNPIEFMNLPPGTYTITVADLEVKQYKLMDDQSTDLEGTIENTDISETIVLEKNIDILTGLSIRKKVFLLLLIIGAIGLFISLINRKKEFTK